jgi:hypothetical protein
MCSRAFHEEEGHPNKDQTVDEEKGERGIDQRVELTSWPAGC